MAVRLHRTGEQGKKKPRWCHMLGVFSRLRTKQVQECEPAAGAASGQNTLAFLC